jgi:hypothetical protein
MRVVFIHKVQPPSPTKYLNAIHSIILATSGSHLSQVTVPSRLDSE